MTERVTLYHYWSSTCSQKARFALIEKGLAWESCHVDLFRFEHWNEDYTRLNQNGMVPTLVDGGRVITDSNVMLEYLEDRSPIPRLRPLESGERAVMRQWMKEADQAQKSVIKAGYNLRYKPRIAKYTLEELTRIATRNPNPAFRRSWLKKLETGVPAEVVAHCYAKLEAMADRIEAQLSKTPWLASEEFGLADIAVSPYMRRIENLEHPAIVSHSVRPRLAEWWQRLQNRNAFREAFSFPNPDPEDPIKS